VGRSGVLATNSCAVFGSVVIPDSNLTLLLLLAFLKPGTAPLIQNRKKGKNKKSASQKLSADCDLSGQDGLRDGGYSERHARSSRGKQTELCQPEK
jgi:hypothetical protein